MNRFIIYYFLIIFLGYFLSDQSIYGQSVDTLKVRGKILNSSKVPIYDVTISLEGSDQKPVISDENGEYEINVISGLDWLSIKHFGFKDKRVLINNRNYIEVYLTEIDLKSVTDVFPVVNRSETGKNIISSYYRSELKTFYQEPAISVDEYFQGRVPGLLITRISGMPGQGATQSLRGLNSINTNNQPLYIVDGIPLENAGMFSSNLDGNPRNPLSGLNPNDFSSITILKSPIATAIYGTKASNGVVLIQTLNPTATKTTIDLTLREGISISPKFLPQLDGDQYKNLANEILSSSPMFEENFEENYPGLYIQKGERNYFPYQHNSNWQKMIFSNSSFRDYYLQVKGGDEIARYGLSVGFNNHNGNIKNSSYKDYNIRLVSRLNVYSWLHMNISASLNNTKSSLSGSAYDATTSSIGSSLVKSPLLNPYIFDDDGNRLNILADADEFAANNPMAIVNNLIARNNTNRIISSVKFEADISKFLKGNILFGFNNNNMDENIYLPNNGMATYYDGLANNVAKGLFSKYFSVYTNSYLNYEQQFNKIHDFNGTIGFRINTNIFEEDNALTKNLPENDQFTDLQSGNSSLREIWGINEKWNWTSLYSNVNYKLKDKYLLSVSLSFENTTKNGAEANDLTYFGSIPFGLFYAAGFGWRISNENFLKNSHWIDNLMLKASYGLSGNDDIGIVNALDYYRQTNYRESAALISGNYPNKSLRNEDIYQMDAGFDLSLLGDRLFMSMTYFRNHTKNLLMYEPMESYIGYESRPTNGGEIINYGLESSLTYRIVNSKNFHWDMDVNFTSINNEVVKVFLNSVNNETNTNGGVNNYSVKNVVTDFKGGQFIMRTGGPVLSFYGYEYLGVFSTSEEADQAGLKNDIGIPFGAGDAKYNDISGPDGLPDGIIDTYDKTNIGSPIPRFYGGLLNSLNYKKWTFSFSWYFVYGNEVFNYLRYQNESMTGLSNQSKSVLNRWHTEGDITDIPRALWNDPTGNSDFSTRWIEDGSYIRLKNVTLSYKLQNVFSVFTNAELFVTASNIFTISKYLGYDPEFNHSFDQMQQGIDYGMMPQTRQFLIGVKLGF